MASEFIRLTSVDYITRERKERENFVRRNAIIRVEFRAKTPTTIVSRQLPNRACVYLLGATEAAEEGSCQSDYIMVEDEKQISALRSWLTSDMKPDEIR